MKTNRLITTAAAALLTLSVAACGGGDDDTATTVAPTTTAAATTTTAASSTTTGAATTTTEAATTTTEAPTTMAADTTMGEAMDEIEVGVQGNAFSTDQIVITAGREVTIVVNDQDTTTDEPHNFHIRTPDADFFTAIKEAPNTQTLTFQIDIPGTYEFFCDTHPADMTGVLIVEEDM